MSRTKSATNKHVVVHVPNRRLARGPVIEHVVWFVVVVEVCVWGTARNSPCEVELADAHGPWGDADCRVVFVGVPQGVVIRWIDWLELREHDSKPIKAMPVNRVIG